MTQNKSNNYGRNSSARDELQVVYLSFISCSKQIILLFNKNLCTLLPVFGLSRIVICKNSSPWVKYENKVLKLYLSILLRLIVSLLLGH